MSAGGAHLTYDFKLSCDLPAPPQAVYDAWLDSAAHSAMTGSEAKIGKHVGDRYTAWDGYISGTTLELAPGRRIAQSWRTHRVRLQGSGFRPSSSTSSRRRRARSSR